MPTIYETLLEYAGTLKANFSARVPAQPEDQLKLPVIRLLKEVGAATKHQVEARTEAQVKNLGARPDIGVTVKGLLCGYVELKAPDKSIDPKHFSDSDKKQWEKLKTLPNLIYTNGTDWRLYQNSQLVENTAFSFKYDVTKLGKEAVSAEVVGKLNWMLDNFFCWTPIVPKNPEQLAELLAPMCHILRDYVFESIQDKNSNLATLAREWRSVLFPDADDARFADAYAQTLTYGLLLARFGHDTPLDLDNAPKRLESHHGLLAQAVRLLAQDEVRKDISVAADLLVRVINAIDLKALAHLGDDPWLYFYEDFLSKYDPKLRKDYGVYYTPHQVIRTQVHLISELLETKFDKELAFADKGVTFLDPAAGTGAYPLYAMQFSLDKVEAKYGKGSVSSHASKVGENMNAFEVLVGPYAVAHMRLTQAILDRGGKLPPEGAQIYLTDTLESPTTGEKHSETLFQKRLAVEHKRAQKVKAATQVLVCLGNPPYDRQERERGDTKTQLKGGWVRFGEGDAQAPQTGILSDFLEPAFKAGRGGDVKNLYNDYVYFWRWALWKVFEQNELPGIVSFITASSYLKGPGFVGMREHMRRVLDELWIIDLEGDNLGARKSQNVFAIQTPVAIAVGIRHKKGRPKTPAKVWYAKIEGTRDEKFSALAEIKTFSSLNWQACSKEWRGVFLPAGKGDYYSWPKLIDIFPWQHSGSQFKRKWPIAETKENLEERWERLLQATGDQRAELFVETRDRKVHREYRNSLGANELLPSIASLKRNSPGPVITRYAYRSFDRKWCILDYRLGDFLKPVLYGIQSPKQVYMTSLLTGVLGEGPAATASHLVPDMDHFRGSFGAKHVIPLYRDAACHDPNVNGKLLSGIQETVSQSITAEDLFAYVYALLSSPDYTDQFREELSKPGPRIPITKDKALFAEVTNLGKGLLWLHTYAERFVPKGKKRGVISKGRAKCVHGVPECEEDYPEKYFYDQADRTLHINGGRFAPVSEEVFSFSVSGLKVVQSWLNYRMKKGAGKQSSELDKIRPTKWTNELTTELLELLWLLEATIDMQPELSRLLKEVVESDVFLDSELPEPTTAETKPPSVEDDDGSDDQIDAFHKR